MQFNYLITSPSIKYQKIEEKKQLKTQLLFALFFQLLFR